jgi:hypothetical protein
LLKDTTTLDADSARINRKAFVEWRIFKEVLQLGIFSKEVKANKEDFELYKCHFSAASV